MNRESKARHTAGKWEVGKTARNEFTSIWVGGTRIALVDEVPHEGSEANARIMAASPELLEALKGLLSWSAHLPFAADDKIEFAKNVIKKIEG